MIFDSYQSINSHKKKRMKTLALLLSFVLTIGVLKAQECPEFVNMIQNISEGSLGTLESPSVENKQKKKGLYRGFDTSIRLEGATSPVKLSSSEAVFIFRPVNPDMHPAQQIKLYPFDINKDFRELATGGMNMFGGSKNRQNDDDSITLQFEKIEKGCYKVTAGGKLPAGQYAFSLGDEGAASVQGQGAGFGTSTSSGQVWYAFSVK